MTSEPTTPDPAVVERAKRIRDGMCIEDVCRFDHGCSCLEAIVAVLSAAAPVSGGDHDAIIAEVVGVINQTAEYWVGSMSGLPTGDHVAEYLTQDLIPNIYEALQSKNGEADRG